MQIFPELIWNDPCVFNSNAFIVKNLPCIAVKPSMLITCAHKLTRIDLSLILVRMCTEGYSSRFGFCVCLLTLVRMHTEGYSSRFGFSVCLLVNYVMLAWLLWQL